MQFHSTRSASSSSLGQRFATKNWRSSGFWEDIFGSSDFGDTPEDAKNIGKLKRGKSYDYSGDVGRNDPDYFRFKVSQKRSPFSARFTNDRNNDTPIAISVLNRKGGVVKIDGQFLFRNIEAGETASLSTQKLAKGTYFFRVLSAEGVNEDYDVEFSLSASPTLPTDNAFDLGRLTPNRAYRYTGYVGKEDIDAYKFSVEATSRISASLFNNSFSRSFDDNSIAISILDDRQRTVQTYSGRYLFANVEPRDEATLFDPTLPPGEYYVRIQSEQGEDLNYQLQLNRSALFPV